MKRNLPKKIRDELNRELKEFVARYGYLSIKGLNRYINQTHPWSYLKKKLKE